MAASAGGEAPPAKRARFICHYGDEETSEAGSAVESPDFCAYSHSGEMSAADDGQPLAMHSRQAIYFGDKELSDVVLTVGDMDFHVHSRFLALRSIHFKKLFDSHPPSGNKRKFYLKEDEVGFRFVLSMLYKQVYDEDVFSDRFWCQRDTELDGDMMMEAVTNNWKWLSGIWRIATKFKCVIMFRPTLERQMLLGNCRDGDCLKCGALILVALHFNWLPIVGHLKTSARTLVTVLTHLSTEPSIDLPIFRIAPVAFSMILDEIIGGTPLKIEVPREDETPEEEGETRRVFSYDQPNAAPSDVTLVLKNSDFEVHKHLLAVHSPYFHALFFGEFVEKDQEKVAIEADEDGFKGVMDLIYHGRLEDEVDFLNCKSDLEESKVQITRFWKRMPSIAGLFDRFDLPVRILADALLFRCPNGSDCIECSSKKLFAIHVDLKNVKDKIPSDPGAVAQCLRSFQEVLPKQLSLTPAEFCDLVKATEEKHFAMS